MRGVGGLKDVGGRGRGCNVEKLRRKTNVVELQGRRDFGRARTVSNMSHGGYDCSVLQPRDRIR